LTLCFLCVDSYELMTADGTGDELIKLEGMPKNYKFTF
jgi:hypothetical protein